MKNRQLENLRNIEDYRIEDLRTRNDKIFDKDYILYRNPFIKVSTGKSKS